MAVQTDFGPTPWSTGELAALHGAAGPRAKVKQEQLDRLIAEVLAPDYVARGVRPDQAAESIRALVARLHRLLCGDPERTVAHVGRLVRVAYDRAAERRMIEAGRRLPADLPLSPPARVARRDPLQTRRGALPAAALTTIRPATGGRMEKTA